MRIIAVRRARFMQLIVGAVVLVGARSSDGATLCVAPGGAGGCFASIQAAADAAPNGSVIEVAAGTYVENLLLTTPSSLVIRGVGAAGTIIDGGGAGSVLVAQTNRLRLEGVTIRNGAADRGAGLRLDDRARVEVVDSRIAGNQASVYGGGVALGSRASLTLTDTTVEDNGALSGAGIHTEIVGAGASGKSCRGGTLIMNRGALRGNVVDNQGPAMNATGVVCNGGARVDLNDVVVEANTVGCVGCGGSGAIRAHGKLVLRRTTVVDNSAGGIFARGSLEVLESTIADNDGGSFGVGGVSIGSLPSFARHKLRIVRSTISGNSAQYGGGVYVRSAKASIETSTISGNSAAIGGGISVWGSSNQARVIVLNSTVAGNSATSSAGGIARVDEVPVTLQATILGDNQAPSGPDCTGSIMARGANLIEDTSDCTVLTIGSGVTTGVDPLLGPLQANGGPTETLELLPGSPARGANSSAGDCRTRDQRGVARTVPCDVGAFEAP